MGFYREDEAQAPCDLPGDWTQLHMWQQLSGLATLPTIMRGSAFPVPLRICHKLLAGTIHARRESQSKVTLSDLSVLYCMFQGRQYNPGMAFLRAVRECGSRQAGTIMIGSLISPLAERYSCAGGEDVPAALAPEYIRGTILGRMGLLIRDGSGEWVFRDLSDEINFDVLPDEFPAFRVPRPPQQPEQQQAYDLADVMRRLDEIDATQERHYQSLYQEMGRMRTAMEEQGRQMADMAETHRTLQRRLDRYDSIPAPSEASSPGPEEGRD